MRRAEPPITGVAGEAERPGTRFFSDRLHGFFDIRKGTGYFTVPRLYVMWRTLYTMQWILIWHTYSLPLFTIRLCFRLS
jgi:hypothetical protein